MNPSSWYMCRHKIMREANKLSELRGYGYMQVTLKNRRGVAYGIIQFRYLTSEIAYVYDMQGNPIAELSVLKSIIWFKHKRFVVL